MGAAGPMLCLEYRDLVAAHADGMLDAGEAARADAHLAACVRCRHVFAASQWCRQEVRAYDSVRPTPAAVRQRILAALDAEAAAEPGAWRRSWWRQPAYRFALAGGLAVLALAVAVVLPRRAPPPTPALLVAVVNDLHAIEGNQLQLAFRTDDPQELRDYFQRTAGLGFSNTVVDLEFLGYELIGGTTVDLDGKRSSLSVYRGTHGMLVCHRFQGAELPLPPGGETIRGETFYTVNGVTVRVHREGDVVCLMASALPREMFIKLWTGST